jgi:hypothetical protein
MGKIKQERKMRKNKEKTGNWRRRMGEEGALENAIEGGGGGESIRVNEGNGQTQIN